MVNVPLLSVLPCHPALELTFYVLTHEVSAASKQMTGMTRCGFNKITQLLPEHFQLPFSR